MPTFEQTEQEFQNLERGTPRLNAIRDAIHEADLRQDIEWRFWFRYDYLKESIFCGDRYYAMIIFPELLQIYENHPKLNENARFTHYMLVAFKWIVEAAPEFPQVSREEIDNYFRLFKRMLLEQGYSLSIYYMKRGLFYRHVDKGIAAACFYQFVDAPLDSIADGRALWYDHQAEYYLLIGEEEKALEAAKPIFDGKMKSNSLPQSTYHDFIRFYMERKDYPQAEYYAKLAEPRVNGDPYYLEVIGTLMSLYSILDVPHGIQLFNRNYPVFLASKNPWLKVYFLFGASHLFGRIAADALSMDMLQVPKESPVYQAVCDKNLQWLADHFYQEAKTAAEKFDKRNGTEDYMQMLHLLCHETQ